MAPRNPKAMAPQLTDDVLEQISESLEAVKKNATPVYRGSERAPMCSTQAPGYGTLLLHATRLIRECAKKRNLVTDLPGALHFERSKLTGYMVAWPVETYDQHDPNLYELKWHKSHKKATIDLLPILQPLNKQVAPGMVLEIPISMAMVNQEASLLFFMNLAEVRAQVPRETDDETETEDDDEDEKE